MELVDIDDCDCGDYDAIFVYVQDLVAQKMTTSPLKSPSVLEFDNDRGHQDHHNG